MTKLEFEALCREASRLLRLPEPEQLGRNEQVELNGHAIGVFFDEDEEPLIHCFVDLGPADEDDRLRMLERVLTLNLELGRMHGESLGLDPRSGHIVLRSEITELALCTPESLTKWLLDYAAFADQFGSLINHPPMGQSTAELGTQLA